MNGLCTGRLVVNHPFTGPDGIVLRLNLCVPFCYEDTKDNSFDILRKAASKYARLVRNIFKMSQYIAREHT